MQNIRSYIDQRIGFPEGSTLLAGDIGSGKSSILQSVEFALFGARRDSVSGDALLRKGADEGKVTLDLEIDGKKVSIMRRLRRQRNTVLQDAGSISINSSSTEATPTELKARILSLLGYPKELLTKPNPLIYRYTVYTPQEDMKNIVTESDEQRIDTLRKVFGIDRYKRVAQNAGIYIKSIKERKKELSGIMQGLAEKQQDLEKRKSELSAASQALQRITPLLTSAKQAKDNAREALEKAEKDVQHLTNIKNRVQVADARLEEIVKIRSKNKTEIEGIQAEASILKKRIEATFLEEKQYPPIDTIEKEVASIEKNLSESSSKKAALKERQQNLLTRADQLGKDITLKSEKLDISAEKESLYKEVLEAIKDKEVISKAVDDTTAMLRKLDTISAELAANKRSSEDLKKQISSLDTCPTCRQDVTEVHKQAIIQQEDHKLNKLAAELEDITSQKQDIIQKLEQNNLKMQKLTDNERRLAALKVEMDNIKNIRSELEHARKQHAELDKEKAFILEQLQQLDSTLTEKLDKELQGKKQLLKDINEYNLKLKEKKHNLALLADKQQRIDNLNKLQEELKQEVSIINADKLKLNEHISSAGPVLEQHQQKKLLLEKASEQEKQAAIQVSEVRKEIEGITAHINMLMKDIAVKDNAGKGLQHLSALQEWLEKMFISLMSAMEKQIMAKVHSQFSELFSGWFNLLIEDENISVRIDDSFSPFITQNGHDTSIGHLSGGEKTSIALAYRLALNKVINDLITNIKTSNILMLDEPTDGFSTEQLDKVRDVLDQLNVKQTIIVSHESKIESFVDHVIRVHKTEHVSRVMS
jgi:exonuclease SbcC